MNSPFFSIIIPVYNGLSHDLPICLESIWNQPLSASLYEVICVDDCSTDDTREWLDEEATKHNNLRIIKHTVNKRQGGGRNTGIKAAQAVELQTRTSHFAGSTVSHLTVLRENLTKRL